MEMMNRPRGLLFGAAGLAALAGVIGMARGRDAAAQDQKPPRPVAQAAGAAAAAAAEDPAVERAREQVKMLDDLYKNAVVSITKTYVDQQDGRP
ncbi:MAG: hypothetical protein ACYC61_08400, partial [Isosphaeraceae bacterium]